jgi:hypothetical protein
MTLTPGTTVTLRVKTVPATAKARKTIERLMRRRSVVAPPR